MRRLALPLLLVVPALAAAQESPPESPLPQAEPARVAARPAGERALQLRLADVGRMALENSPRFRARMLDPDIARAAAMETLGEFDPLLGGRFTGGADRSEVFFNPGTFGGGGGSFLKEDTLGGSANASAVQEWGGVFTLGYSASSSARSGAASISALSPRYSGALSMGYTHPLLRGAGREVRLSRYREAMERALQSEESLAREAELTVLEAETLYWDLVNARADLDVVRASIRLAEELLSVAKARVDAGRGIPVDVSEAKAGLARREGERIEIENRVRNLSDRLRELILPFDGPDADLDISLQPLDQPVVDLPTAPAHPGREDLEAAALRRGDVRAAASGVDVARQAVVRARNDEEVELNALLGGTLRGLGSGFHKSSSQIGDADSYVWEAGLEVSVPLGNVAAEARLLRAETELRRAERQLASARNTIIREVRESVRNVRSALESIEAARRERQATSEQLDAERSRLEKGRSTPFAVLEVEEDHSRAIAAEIGSRVALEKAQVALDAARGRLLEERGLVPPTETE